MDVPAPSVRRLDPSRPDYEAILDAHAAAVNRGEPFYVDPTSGLMVMTVATLLARGTCCSSGCRHCPFVN